MGPFIVLLVIVAIVVGGACFATWWLERAPADRSTTGAERKQV
jgi:hypothetical protein